MSDTLVKVLGEKRQNIWQQAKAITDKAAEEGRDLTADEAARFDAASADMDQLAERCKSLADAEARNKAIEASLGIVAGGERRDAESTVGAQMRSWLLNDDPSKAIEFQSTGRDYRDAVASRALSSGTPSAGGILKPTTFAARMYEFLIDAAGILQAGPTILETGTGENIDVPVVTSFGSAQRVAEAGSLAGTDPAFDKRTLGAYKYGELVDVPTELLNDSFFDLEGFIARIAGRNCGIALSADLAVGTGSNRPAGVVTSATAGVTSATGVSGAFNADNLLDLKYSVAAPYRNSSTAVWLAKDTSLATIRKFKDTSGRYLFSPGTPAGLGEIRGVSGADTVDGNPIFTDPNIAAPALNAKSLVFGDISTYWVRLAGGVRFERSDHYRFGTDVVSFRAIVRGDGVQVDQTGAVKAFVGAAS